MSASPVLVTHSTKRSLEEASSPSRTADQPESKRPTLNKVGKNDDQVEMARIPEENVTGSAQGDEDGIVGRNIGVRTMTTDPTGASILADAKNGVAAAVANLANQANQANPAGSPQAAPDESSWIHIRAVISSPEAATIIGKGGENVSNIRKMSGARCTISDYQKGAVERILTVSGVVEDVAKAFGLIIRTLNNEALGETSTAQSKTYPLRLLVPHVLIGSIIGKGGARIREIQEMSGARLNASDSCLPLSSERSLVVMGVADAVHIATYYVGSTLLEQLNDRFGGAAASAYATRSGGAAGAVPGGMQVVPYTPQPAGGNYGNRDQYSRMQERRGPVSAGGYADGSYQASSAPVSQPMPMYGGPVGSSPYMPVHPAGPSGPTAAGGPLGGPVPGGVQGGQQGGPMYGQPSMTQQIYIPNEMVGAIIGKGGQKINEIRQMSGSIIKINEPQDNSNERLVTISGSAECNRIALYLLYTRLEQEKHRI